MLISKNQTSNKTPVSFFLGLFFTSYFLFSYYADVSFSIENLKSLIISQATAEGVDISARVNLFYQLAGIGTVLFLTIYFTSNRLVNISQKNAQSIIFIALVGTCSVITSIIGTNSDALSQIVFYLVLYLLPCFILESKFNILKIINQPTSVSVTGIFAFLTMYLLLFLFGNHIIFTTYYALFYVLLFLVFQALFILMYVKWNKNVKEFSLLLLPISFLPVLTFLSIEIAFYFREVHDQFLNYKLLFGALFIAIILLHLFLVKRIKKQRRSFKNTLTYFWGPSFITCFILLSQYKGILHQPTELFELANPANSVMRVFKFHEIPFLDFMSSHLLFEQWYGYLYSLIFDYNGTTDFLAYGFLNEFIFLFILYLFLNKLFHKPLLSAFFIVVFPFSYDVFFPPIFTPIVLLYLILRNESAKNYFLLFTAIASFVFWRLDSGAAALLGILLFLPLYWICEKRYPKPFQLLKAIVGFLITTGLLLLLFSAFNSWDILLFNMKSAVHYISGNQAHGYPRIAHTDTIQFYVYHFLFPALAILAILYIIKTLRSVENKKKPLVLYASLFLFVLTFINVQRGLVRHGFAEDNELYIVSLFFIATTLLLIHLAKNKIRGKEFTVFYTTLFSLFVLFKFFSNLDEDTLLQQGLQHSTFLTFTEKVDQKNYTGRTIHNQEFEQNSFTELKLFLDENLKEDETFLDFSNTPMLYFYCQRRIPGYFNQNLQNTIDDYLQVGLLKYLNPKHVPVVVYSNNPPNWFDATDGIPNAMRYYIIADYIHSNYRPHTVLSGKTIWVSKTANQFGAKINEEVDKDLWSQHNYKSAAGLIGGYFSTRQGLQLLFEYDNTTDDSIAFNIPSEFCGIKNCYVSIELEPNENTIIDEEIVVSLNDGTTGKLSFTTNQSQNQKYLMRISSLYNWHQLKNCILSFNKHSRKINKISLFKDVRFEN